ncbi:MAG: 16S rRNA (cytosine(967)-C(5))-methyltransferase RsmB [Ruminococcaceae bacterium]|jgi:16S rRNA (cytosine967-C5)-methyltransferase|nr:16S rRNA (cytosine(967)-C(5))-methyltransferase RsmB [Oscillospiraceae bacterium]
MNERASAYKVLLKILKNNSYSNIALDSVLNESDSDSGSSLVTNLVYGTLERQITIDYVLSKYLKQPVEKTKPEILVALRLGVYQLLFTDKIPPFAAVNESVNIIKKSKFSFASGLVNSVLRKVADEGFVYPETEDIIFNLSIKYSCPEELVKHYVDNYGVDNATDILSSSIGSAPVFLKVNTLKTSASVLKETLEIEGVKAEIKDENALKISSFGSPENLKSFNDGLFHVQDYSCILCCKTLGAKENETVIDVCASPGGKSFSIAEMMNNKGKVISCDLYSQRVGLIESGAKRLGIDIIETKENDASVFNSSFPLADRVLCDVPCSGLGVIRRKKEIRFKKPLEFDNLCDMQYNILTVSSKYVRSGGVLVYSTCTLNPKENEENCNRFLNEHKDFRKDGEYINIFPKMYDSDGFFIARFVRE